MQTFVDQTYIDDPLRILRCIRMSCVFGFNIAPETFESMKRNVDRLEIITKERVQSELNKILLCDNAVMGINTLHEIGAMKYVIPEFDKCYGLEQNDYHFGDVSEHTLAVLGYHCSHFDPNLVERLACLLHDIGKIETVSVKDGRVHFYEHEYAGAKMCVDILKRLKYDNHTIDEVSFLIKNHMRTKQGGNGGEKIKDKSLNKLLYECKTQERFDALIKVIECDNMSHKSEHNIHNQYYELWLRSKSEKHRTMFGYKLPITGDDIMETLHIGPGPMVREIIRRLTNKAFQDPFITREQCIKFLPGIKKEAENALSKKGGQ